jgi:hypothetical protein
VQHYLRAFCALFVLAVLTACQTPNAPQDPSLNAANAASIYIYRTQQSFHSLNPEKPYFYIDGQHVANLGTGETTLRLVPPGPHRISGRGTFMFAPAGELGGIDIVTEAGKAYYIRYSLDPGMLIGTNFTTSSSFSIVDEAFYRQRR